MGKTYYHKYDKSNKKEADKKAKATNYQNPRKTDYVEIKNRPGYMPGPVGVAPGGGVAAYIASKFGVFDKKVRATRPPDQVGINPKTKTYKSGSKKEKKAGTLKKLIGIKPAN